MHHSAAQNNPRQIVIDAIQHLDHVLPGQAPIHDFVHHNTLHGFQHLPFEQALREFSSLTGIDCYLSSEQFRDFYAQGRISDDDLDSSLQRQFPQCEQDILYATTSKSVTRLQLYRLALLCDLPILTAAEWEWQVHERGLLDSKSDTAGNQLIWNGLLEKLQLSTFDLHPEQLLDLSPEQVECWLPGNSIADHRQARQQAQEAVQSLFSQVGDSLTLRGVLKTLTGIDILDTVRPQLIRWCASMLDEGLAPWRLPQRQALGFYGAWRQAIDYDAGPLIQDLAEWHQLKSHLPQDAIDAIMQQLEVLAIPVERWTGYLQRLSLELPGWSGLINWRQTHPAYASNDGSRPELADYLAIRLILDRLSLHQLCREQWHCPARFDKLQQYFTKHSAEFFVRKALFSGALPEYLAQSAQHQLANNPSNPPGWQTLAERIWTWQNSPLAVHRTDKPGIFNQGWRLFLSCRWLGLEAADIRQLERNQLLGWLYVLDGFDQHQRGYVWLNAYERHYQQNLLQALYANHNRGRWAQRDTRPQAQVYFCMDEREESFRRHLEELNPCIETLGVAGFFGVAMNYQGLDAHHVTPLCPVVVTPVHQVNEVIQPGQESQLAKHTNGMKKSDHLAYQLYQSLRGSLFAAVPLLFAFAPVKLLQLLGQNLFPTWQHYMERYWQRFLVPGVMTQLQFHSEIQQPASLEQPKLGFNDQEQADRVAGFLRTTGLISGLAKLVVLIGHGSTSQNNPHEAAHDCGACGGRQGGPNARVFSAMANREPVRKLLSDQGIRIPDDTWFVGAQHDTCSDALNWFDVERIPEHLEHEFSRLKATILEADGLAAIERCRRFASAGKTKSAAVAVQHVENRAMDLSQVRPEFGHATNAAAFIGRRSATQGIFFDRRLFLISYDPGQDADGKILENILLTAGPVGAGINLEYFFSSVNNERLGCGTKIPHNVTGLFGVLEGAGSDLRTGLPLQMVEIHEAMRLQIVVEAKTSVLEAIYSRQPSLQELIGGGWVHVCAKDPESGEIYRFEPEVGFVPWRAADCRLPLRKDSADCYRDEQGPVAPLLIKQPEWSGEKP